MLYFLKIIIGCMFIVLNSLLINVYAQQFMFVPNKQLNEIHTNAMNYFDSLQNIHGSSILEGEGSEYNHYMKFYYHWSPRLSGYNDDEIESLKTENKELKKQLFELKAEIEQLKKQ